VGRLLTFFLALSRFQAGRSAREALKSAIQAFENTHIFLRDKTPATDATEHKKCYPEAAVSTKGSQKYGIENKQLPIVF